MDKAIMNFKKWLDKLQVESEIIACNDNYFDNAPVLNFEVISVHLQADTIPAIRELENKIKKYVKRYAINIYLPGRVWFNNYHNCYTYSFTAMSAAAKAATDNYYFYSDQAKTDIENLLHEYHIENTYHSKHEEAINRCKAIMNYYGRHYLQSLEAQETKTA